MIKEGVLNTESMRNHCEGESEPSYWISMTDNPQWLMERSPLCRGDIQRYDKRHVAFVNVEKLKRMGVIFQRSDLLALQANIAVYSTSNQQGVKYTSVDHWLAFSWIPPQCIERIVSLRSFRALYKAHGFESKCDFLQPSALANINVAQTLFSNVCQKNCSQDLRTQRFWISFRQSSKRPSTYDTVAMAKVKGEHDLNTLLGTLYLRLGSFCKNVAGGGHHRGVRTMVAV